MRKSSTVGMVTAAVAVIVAGLLSGIVLAERPGATQAAAAAPAAADSRTWIGHAAEMEEYLRTVAIQKLEDLSVGVTRPKKAYLPEGGPFKYLVWKPIQSGRYGGFWESYKGEIAAYELDRILGLNMVPPTIEKSYKGERGAAIMWVSPTKSFKELGGTGAPTAPPQEQVRWARQLVKAKMFHNLTNNVDPNLGNWLVDPAWNLVLIDFSRAFVQGRNMAHTFTRVDEDLWNKMKGLTEESLTPTLGPWLGKGEIRSILQRRDKMQEIIVDLVKKSGEAFVFMRDEK